MQRGWGRGAWAAGTGPFTRRLLGGSKRRLQRLPLPRARALRYTAAGSAPRPASHSDIASAETPSALASGASPPQARSARDKVCTCGEGLDMRQLAAPPRFSLCGSEHRNARVDSTRSARGGGPRATEGAGEQPLVLPLHHPVALADARFQRYPIEHLDAPALVANRAGGL